VGRRFPNNYAASLLALSKARFSFQIRLKWWEGLSLRVANLARFTWSRNLYSEFRAHGLSMPRNICGIGRCCLQMAITGADPSAEHNLIYHVVQSFAMTPDQLTDHATRQPLGLVSNREGWVLGDSTPLPSVSSWASGDGQDMGTETSN
jgi:hypothetical protein